MTLISQLVAIAAAITFGGYGLALANQTPDPLMAYTMMVWSAYVFGAALTTSLLSTIIDILRHGPRA